MNPNASQDRPLAAKAALLSLLVALFAAVLVNLAAGPQTAYADDPTLAIDVDPAGNSPTEIDSVDTCVPVAMGDSFEVDVLIENVQELLAWEANVRYDPAILEVSQRDVRMFQQANSGSSVYDLSDRVPDSDGVYRLSAADTSFPPTPDSGSGVLARVTLTAVAPGTSELSLASEDLDEDGKLDRGTFLRNADSLIIGDSDDDTLFDGETQGAQVAVDRECPPGSTTNSRTEEGGGISGIRVLYLVLPGLAVAAALGAYIMLSRRRARPQSP